MKTDFDYIVVYLEEKEKAAFTGSVKFGIEKGKLTSITESNRLDGFDVPASELPKEHDYAALLKPVLVKDFYGSFAYVFDKGSAKKYNYVKSLKGDTLQNFLEARK